MDYNPGEFDECLPVYNDFSHYDEIIGIIKKLGKAVYDVHETEGCMQDIKRIIDLYQDQPHLLDVHLNKLLGLLFCMIVSPGKYLIAPEEQSTNAPYPDLKLEMRLQHFVCETMYLVCKTRGYKVVARYMPHEVNDLEFPLLMLEDQDPSRYEHFCTHYVMLLWLSTVSMIPFELSRVAAGLQPLDDARRDMSLQRRLYEVGKKFLDGAERVQVLSGFFLAHFLSRPDVLEDGFLSEAVYWTCDNLKNLDLNSVTDQKFGCSLMYVLAMLMKYGDRTKLAAYVDDPILPAVFGLQTTLKINSLMKKMISKVLQRLALIYLKPRLLSWRYSRGQRTLEGNLNLNKQSQLECAMNGRDIGLHFSPVEKIGESVMAANLADNDIEIHENVGEVMDHLVGYLRDRDNVVRWSAAKGIGRICNRLQLDHLRDVVEAITLLFSRLEPSFAWHGACLALAELARRGLLLPDQLPGVLPKVMDSLLLEEKNAAESASTANNVRDAACYVCWAFARAYSPAELNTIMQPLAQTLVILTLFDREVNVRRAAAAAFQEHVGRQGQFPHGIDILTNCDYFAVGRRQYTFLELSVYVAQFEMYRFAIIEHLSTQKLSHWDPKIRELASQALCRLTPLASDHMVRNVLPRLIKDSTAMNLLRRHGAILSLGEVLYALQGFDQLPEHLKEEICQITYKLADGNHFRGSTGELMRQAVCLLIQRCSQVSFPIHDSPVITLWKDFLMDCIASESKNILDAGVEAIAPFLATYLYDASGFIRPHFHHDVLYRLISPLKNANCEALLIGCVRSIGVAVKELFLAPDYYALISPSEANEISNSSSTAISDSSFSAVDLVIGQLLKVCDYSSKSKWEKWGRARKEAVTSVVKVVENFGVVHEAFTMKIYSSIFETFIHALTDYTVSNCGDIGALVREEAMLQLQRLVLLLNSHNVTEILTEDLMKQLFGNVIKQAAEKIDRTRVVASSVLITLLHDEAKLSIPAREELLRIFPKSVCDKVIWLAPQETFPLLVQVLEIPDYRAYLLEGLVISVGGLTESTARHSADALTDIFQAHFQQPDLIEAIIEDTLNIFQKYLGVNRVSFPMLKFLDLLLRDGIVVETLQSQRHLPITERLYKLTGKEIHRSKDVHKIKAAVDVYRDLLQYHAEIRIPVLRSITSLLVHIYPVVRKNTASKFYETILMCELADDQTVDKLSSLLLDTIWESDLKELREVQKDICNLLEIPSVH